MDYERPVKALIIVAGLIVLTATMFQVWSWHTLSEINSMSRDLNDAERPEAYQEFISHINSQNFTEKELGALNSSLKGKTLSSRLKFSGRMLLDAGIAVRYFFRAVQGNATKINRTARYFAHCQTRSQYIEKCRNQDNLPISVLTASGWMELGKRMGALHALWENKTALKHFNNYLERAEYYDSRLRKGGFQLKPIEMAYYTDKGLYLIGSLQTNITIDNQKIGLERKGKLLYADVDLQPGVHKIKASSQVFKLKVIHYIPDLGINDEGKFVVDGKEGGYRKAILNGSKGVVNLEFDGNKTVESEVPSEKYIGEGVFENSTRYRPFNVTLVSPEVNVSLKEGTPQKRGVDSSQLYFYGMTKEEYRKTKEAFKDIKSLFGLQKEGRTVSNLFNS